MKTARILIETEDGQRLASYTGVSLDSVAKVTRAIDFVLGAARAVGDVRRVVAEVSEALAPKKRGRR